MEVTEKSLRAIGGVSAEMHKPALSGHQPAEDDLAPAARVTGAHPKFRYHGGPVVNAPDVYASFWGSPWSSDPDHQQRKADLEQFLQDFLASSYMDILSQYGAGSGAGQAGSFKASGVESDVMNQIQDTHIHRILQTTIDSGALPEPRNLVVMIYLADGIEVKGPGPAIMCEPHGDNAFGYHSSFVTAAGNACYYSVIPSLNDACLQSSCPSDQQCSLHLALNQEQRQTQVSSHEFSEMVTDPEGTGWFDGSTGAENGDICNGESGSITVAGRTWTVQMMYSKHDDQATHGRTTCIDSAPQPIPRVH
jgi:hypothetical protein